METEIVTLQVSPQIVYTCNYDWFCACYSARQTNQLQYNKYCLGVEDELNICSQDLDFYRGGLQEKQGCDVEVKTILAKK